MFAKVHAETDQVEISLPGKANPGKVKKGKGRRKTKNFLKKTQRLPGSAWRTAWKVGKEDPKRVIYALKVGVSLTLASLLYLMEPLFEGIGENTIWAVMTVVLVLEFTAGATLCKGFNRGLGTLLAGSLGFYIQYVVNESNRIFHAIFIGIAVFLIGAASAYLRFFPYIKKNYDYGVIIFLLTFNLITVTSYRVDNVLKIARDRFYTIVIGCVTCLLMSLLIFPHWSGETLHNFTASKLEGLAKSIEACVDEYFNDIESEETDNESTEDGDDDDHDLIYEGYKAVLDSKSNDETLALHASWEPRHSRHCYKYPWKQYVKLGGAIRNFGYTVVALHGCLRNEIQTPRPVRALFKNPCTRLSGEVSRVLMELASSIRSRRRFSPEILSGDLQEALRDLNTAMKSSPPPPPNDHQPHDESKGDDDDDDHHHHDHNNNKSAGERKIMLKKQPSRIAVTSLEFSEALPLAAFASLLVEAVVKLDHVIDEVEVLGKRARYYKEFQSSRGSINGGHDHESNNNNNNNNNNENDNHRVRVTCETPRVIFPE